MAARVLSRRWFLRDVPRTYVLFVWLAFGLATLIYAIDWRPSGWSALRQEAAAKPQRRDAEYYTGSIVIVPARGDYLRELLRGGGASGKGSARRHGSLRMNAIGKAFNRGTDN